jgi:hypothetical protein
MRAALTVHVLALPLAFALTVLPVSNLTAGSKRPPSATSPNVLFLLADGAQLTAQLTCGQGRSMCRTALAQSVAQSVGRSARSRRPWLCERRLARAVRPDTSPGSAGA